MNRHPLVSIITVNYNQSAVTSSLLNSLRAITYPLYEIIVVDNCSPNDNPDVLKESFPEITLIKTEENLGFAGGNNVGIKASKGEYIMLINNDTEVPSGFLEPLVELLEGDSSIGMVSPKIKFYWDPSIIQYAGFTRMNPYTIRNRGIGYHQPDGPEYNNLCETDSIHGAAMMIPRRVIEQIGLMTEVYFLYYEEHDWAEIAKKAGYKLYYQPASFILHKESVSTGKESPLRTYYLTRGRIIYTRRNVSGYHLFISLLFQVFFSLPKNTLTLILQRKFKNMLAYWRAYLWNITHYKGIQSNPKL
ncbi:MAG: glycosyltransferase family 2 protein [Bacteroidales bacterium]|nr:glycosyltransferase family 2 protein [Bacteroidales bacterium]